ncbi:MAG: histidine kinase [Acidobacteria bacterium]|nr:histidine kinase [Acidobacteriota bacterium]
MFRSPTFSTRILIRIAALLASLALIVVLVLWYRFYLSASLVALVVAAQIHGLFRLVEKSNLRLAAFLDAVQQSDFTQGVSDRPQGSGFDQLDAAFAGVMERFRAVRLEREEQVRLLNAVVQNVDSGLLAFTEDGATSLCNSAARRLLGAPEIRSLDALEALCPELGAWVRQADRDDSCLVKVARGDRLLQLAVRVTVLQLRGRRLRILAFQNIADELAEKESEAWQNMVRVFTHEIRNSLTPVGSLASTVQEMLASGRPSERIEDMNEALATIQSRSRGLLEFVSSYRDLTHLQQPVFEEIPARDLLRRIETLIASRIEGQPITVRTTVTPPALRLTVDPGLMEQAMLNVVINAIEALTGRPDGEITVAAQMSGRGRPYVAITDNGPGIVAEAQDKVFVPFYSTKREGSGIGLALSRRIMRLHRGELTVRSVPGRQTVFTLQL